MQLFKRPELEFPVVRTQSARTVARGPQVTLGPGAPRRLGGSVPPLAMPAERSQASSQPIRLGQRNPVPPPPPESKEETITLKGAPVFLTAAADFLTAIGPGGPRATQRQQQQRANLLFGQAEQLQRSGETRARLAQQQFQNQQQQIQTQISQGHLQLRLADFGLEKAKLITSLSQIGAVEVDGKKRRLNSGPIIEIGDRRFSLPSPDELTKKAPKSFEGLALQLFLNGKQEEAKEVLQFSRSDSNAVIRNEGADIVIRDPKSGEEIRRFENAVPRTLSPSEARLKEQEKKTSQIDQAASQAIVAAGGDIEGARQRVLAFAKDEPNSFVAQNATRILQAINRTSLQGVEPLLLRLLGRGDK